jgi:hypothetical protein
VGYAASKHKGPKVINTRGHTIRLTPLVYGATIAADADFVPLVSRPAPILSLDLAPSARANEMAPSLLHLP